MGQARIEFHARAIGEVTIKRFARLPGAAKALLSRREPQDPRGVMLMGLTIFQSAITRDSRGPVLRVSEIGRQSDRPSAPTIRASRGSGPETLPNTPRTSPSDVAHSVRENLPCRLPSSFKVFLRTINSRYLGQSPSPSGGRATNGVDGFTNGQLGRELGGTKC